MPNNAEALEGGSVVWPNGADPDVLIRGGMAPQ